MQKIIEVSDYELERGKPMPSLNHAIVQTRLIILLAKFQAQYSIMSELTIELEGEFFNPDICLLSAFSPDFENDKTRYVGPPICTFEILSPTQALGDLIIKMNKLIDSGVKSYWLIIPATETIYVYNHKKERSTFISGLVKDLETGIEIEMAELFR